MEFTDAIEDQVRLRLKVICGVDEDGKEYSSLDQLWSEVLQPKKQPDGSKRSEWYDKANTYWENESNCPISDDGVLGGYGHITPVDIEGSRAFLHSLQGKLGLQFNRVADCGAGVGRITKNLLKDMFQHVDLIEQSHRLITSAPAYIGVSADSDQISFIEQGLQHFQPAPNTYDVIWIQWVIGHLHDKDFIAFIQRCVQGLTEGGVVVIKDNVISSPDQTFYLDTSDNSVCRNIAYLKVLLEIAEVQVVLEQVQTGFPSELYPVHMLAIRSKR